MICCFSLFCLYFLLFLSFNNIGFWDKWQWLYVSENLDCTKCCSPAIDLLSWAQNPKYSLLRPSHPPCLRFQKGSVKALTFQEVYIWAAWCPRRSTSCEYSASTLKDSFFFFGRSKHTTLLMTWLKPCPLGGRQPLLTPSQPHNLCRGGGWKHHPQCRFTTTKEVFVKQY